MEYSEFISEILQTVSEKMGQDYQVTSKRVLRYNSVVLYSLVIEGDGHHITPSIYLESFYQKFLTGRSIPSIADEIIKTYRHYVSEGEKNISVCLEPEVIRENIIYRLINYEKNSELLEDTCHVRVNDLAVVFFYCVSDNSEGISSIRMTKSLCERFGIREEELLQLARTNTEKRFPAVIRPIAEILTEMLDKRTGDDGKHREDIDALRAALRTGEPAMYVLSNDKGLNGATCLLYDGIMEKCREKLGDSFYILPSSIHEVILVPDTDNVSEEGFEDMIRTVNATEVSAEDFLSDTLYRYPEDSFTIDMQDF